MKIFRNLFLIGFIISFLSCQSSYKNPGDFKLLPLPQEFIMEGLSSLKFNDIQNYFSPQNVKLPVLGNLLGGVQRTDNHDKAQIIFSIDNTLDMKAEGYLMIISDNRITITGKDEAGVFYAFRSLEQLMEDAQEQKVYLPLCSIRDYPALAYRAIHLDIKHHLEKTEYYYQLMDKLASYKINAIIVEMEDKIAYQRQPVAGSEDALTIQEWKKLCEYANERNIEISPLIQGLGHSSFILKHEQYENLRDDPASDWAFNPLDPKTYEVQFDLYLDAIEATPHGKYLHIGGDEVHTTGRQSGKSALELQLSWLDKVCKFAEEHDRIPIFWDDMPLKQANVYRPMFNPGMTKEEVDLVWKKNEHVLLAFLNQFPKNCIYMRWNYSSPQAYGNGKAMEWFIKHDLKVMGATAGQTRWVLMPQNQSNMENIRSFAASSIENDLKGLLLTLWDDDSPHFELYMRGIIAFAEYTWTGDTRTKDDIKSAYRQREFSNTLAGNEFAFVDKLEQPVAFWKNALLRSNKRNQLKKILNPLESELIELPKSDNKGEWSLTYSAHLKKAENILLTCDSISETIKSMKSKAIRNTYRLEVYEQVNELVSFTVNALLILKTFDEAKNQEEESKALDQIKQLPAKFDALRNKFEEVYSVTRILNKPANYILDQDHHSHLANQSINFDWQFLAEIMFLEKISNTFK